MFRGYASQKSNVPFRIWYSRLNELNALLTDFQYIILSATMTPSTKAKIITSLEVDPTKLHTITISPIKENLIFKTVFLGGNPLEIFDQYAELLLEGKIEKRIMIITQTKIQASNIFSKFESYLEEKIFKNGDYNVRERLVEMFIRITPDEVKQHIIKDMTDPNGNIKILVCTNAFGMGIDCKNVNTVLHFGPPRTVETYLQECGRAGRDGCVSNCVLFYNRLLCSKIQEEMSKFVFNVKKCRRKCLMECFSIEDDTQFKGCLCCDVCLKFCDCDRPHDIMEELNEIFADVRRRNRVDNEVKSKIEADLRSAFKGTVYSETPVMIPNTYFQFGEYQIQQILNNIEKIFTLEDVRQWVDTWTDSDALKVLQTLNSVFDDIELPTYPIREESFDPASSDKWHGLLSKSDDENDENREDKNEDNENECKNIEGDKNDTSYCLDDTVLETTIEEEVSFVEEK